MIRGNFKGPKSLTNEAESVGNSTMKEEGKKGATAYFLKPR